MAELNFEATTVRWGQVQPEEATEPNVYLGQGALEQIEAKGETNTAIGYDALQDLTEGIFNVALGHHAGSAVTAGIENTALGAIALRLCTTGSKNTAVGMHALQDTTGSENTALGCAAANKNATGEKNVAIGANALASNKTGSGNVAIGWEAAKATGNVSNQLYIANSETEEPLIYGEFPNAKLRLNASELGFFKHAAHPQPEVTGATVTTKQLAEALALIGLIKVN